MTILLAAGEDKEHAGNVHLDIKDKTIFYLQRPQDSGVKQCIPSREKKKVMPLIYEPNSNICGVTDKRHITAKKEKKKG